MVNVEQLINPAQFLDLIPSPGGRGGAACGVPNTLRVDAFIHTHSRSKKGRSALPSDTVEMVEP